MTDREVWFFRRLLIESGLGSKSDVKPDIPHSLIPQETQRAEHEGQGQGREGTETEIETKVDCDRQRGGVFRRRVRDRVRREACMIPHSLYSPGDTACRT